MWDTQRGHMKGNSAFSTNLCWNGTTMFEVAFFVMEFCSSSPFPDLTTLIKEPHKHKKAAWRSVRQVIDGLQTVPAYQLAVWEALLMVAVLCPERQTLYQEASADTTAPRTSEQHRHIHANHIRRLYNSIRNTNAWCSEAAQNWRAVHLRSQDLERRLEALEENALDSDMAPALRRPNLSNQRNTSSSRDANPAVDTRVFLAPVSLVKEKPEQETDGHDTISPPAVLVTHSPGAPYWPLSGEYSCPFTIDGAEVKSVIQAVTRLAETHYGEPAGCTSSEFPSHLRASDEIKERYTTNLPQLLAYAYAHRINQDSQAASTLLSTGHARIGYVGRHRQLAVGFKTSCRSSLDPTKWHGNLVGKAIEKVRTWLQRGHLPELLQPLDHTQVIMPVLGRMVSKGGAKHSIRSSLDPSRMEPVGATNNEPELSKEQHLDEDMQSYLNITPGGHPQEGSTSKMKESAVRPSWVNDVPTVQQSFCEAHYKQYRKWPTQIYVDTNCPTARTEGSSLAFRVSRKLFTPVWIKQLTDPHRSRCSRYLQEHGHWPTQQYAHLKLLPPYPSSNKKTEDKLPVRQNDQQQARWTHQEGEDRQSDSSRDYSKAPARYERSTNTPHTIKKERPNNRPWRSRHDSTPPGWVQRCPPILAAQCRQQFETYGTWPNEDVVQAAIHWTEPQIHGQTQHITDPLPSYQQPRRLAQDRGAARASPYQPTAVPHRSPNKEKPGFLEQRNSQPQETDSWPAEYRQQHMLKQEQAATHLPDQPGTYPCRSLAERLQTQRHPGPKELFDPRKHAYGDQKMRHKDYATYNDTYAAQKAFRAIPKLEKSGSNLRYWACLIRPLVLPSPVHHPQLLLHQLALSAANHEVLSDMIQSAALRAADYKQDAQREAQATSGLQNDNGNTRCPSWFQEAD